MERLRVELTSVALNEALVVRLLRHVPDIVEQLGLLGLLGLSLLLLVDIVHGVQLLKLQHLTIYQINFVIVIINQNIFKH